MSSFAKILVLLCSVFSFAGLISSHHMLSAAEDRVDSDDRNEYNLYERNRDQRDFNRYSNPDERGGSNANNSNSYYDSQGQQYYFQNNSRNR